MTPPPHSLILPITISLLVIYIIPELALKLRLIKQTKKNTA